jgi:hypothetical protein
MGNDLPSKALKIIRGINFSAYWWIPQLFKSFDACTRQALCLQISTRQVAADRKLPLYVGRPDELRTTGMDKWMTQLSVYQSFARKRGGNFGLLELVA